VAAVQFIAGQPRFPRSFTQVQKEVNSTELADSADHARIAH
jgi:hypothetical protein